MNETNTAHRHTALDQLLAGRQHFVDFVERRTGSRSDAEDIVQAAFLRSLDVAGDLDSETVTAWFYRVLRNAIVDHYRHSSAGHRMIEALSRELPSSATPAIQSETCGCIQTVLEGVKPEYRQAIETVDLQEKSLRDLASKAGITPENAAVRVHRARVALRKEVQKACGACADHRCLDCSCKKATPSKQLRTEA